jgi:hypothetical protein
MADEYLAKAALFAGLAETSRYPRTAQQYRDLSQAYERLARTEAQLELLMPRIRQLRWRAYSRAYHGASITAPPAARR